MARPIDIEPERMLEAFAVIPHSDPLVSSFKELINVSRGMKAQCYRTEGTLPEEFFEVTASPNDREGRNLRLILLAQPNFPSTSLTFCRRVDNTGDRPVAAVSLGYELVPFAYRLESSVRFSGHALNLGESEDVWLLKTVSEVGQKVNKYLKKTRRQPSELEPMVAAIFRGGRVAEEFRSRVGLVTR